MRIAFLQRYACVVCAKLGVSIIITLRECTAFHDFVVTVFHQNNVDTPSIEQRLCSEAVRVATEFKGNATQLKAA